MPLSKFFSDIFTGPDGSTFALCRVYSVPILAVGLFAVTRAALATTPVPLADIAVGLGGVGGTVAAMVRATNQIDQQGK